MIHHFSLCYALNGLIRTYWMRPQRELVWYPLGDEKCSEETRRIVTEAEGKYDGISFDCAATSFHIDQWATHFPALCAMLGIKTPKQRKQLKVIEQLEEGGSVGNYLRIQYCDGIAKTSYIRFTAHRSPLDHHYHLQFERARLPKRQIQEPVVREILSPRFVPTITITTTTTK